LELGLASLPDTSVLRPCAPTATIPTIRTPAHRKATTVRNGSSVACLSGLAPGTTVIMGLVSITVDGTAADGMAHMLLLMAMPTIAEPFPRITAQLPMRSLAADSAAVPKVSTAADVANHREARLK
jgi:hypothetical protein